MALKSDFDILCISETWFKPAPRDTNASVEIEGYRVYRLDRPKKEGGGVCAYIKSHLKARILKDLTGITESGLHQLYIQVQSKNIRSIVLGVIYRPPEIGVTCLTEELMPTYIKALALNKDIIMCGDLNCDLLSTNPKGEALRSFITSVNASQLIDKPTRVTQTSRSLIDVIIVSNPNIVKTSGVLDKTISDHNLILVTLNLKVPKLPPSAIMTRSFKKYDPHKFAEDVARVPWDCVELADSLNDRVDAFNDLFITCLDSYAPVKTVKLKHRPCPFITEDIRERMASRDRLQRQAQRTGNEHDWLAFKTLRKDVKQALRKAEQDFF
ncbi:uncharacterized protein LOC114575823 [Exaiptasia diaphana]|uniref:Endonuclease/exonuclease/phosphatase domain-containing protein n=1 Tax=Exaiptasia diaphana TaxID=2652724 RepID=A0A913YRQ8_EXADI|nr:uncharacterized protein LOC114575823 [Exaiptasia diaphana]